MAELFRAAALTGYLTTMKELGADPRPLLRQAGLSPALLNQPEQMISAVAALRLLEESSRETGCATIGLRMAAGRSLANLGAPSLLIAHQPTLRHALDALSEFRARINSTLNLHFEETGGVVILREHFALRHSEDFRQGSSLALGVLARLCATVLGENWAPQTVCFTHAPPLPAEIAIYRRVFRCAPQFDSEFNGLVLDPSDLDRLNPKADTELAVHARQLLEIVMRPDRRSAAEDVEQLIILLLPSGRATIQSCATSLGMKVRTLQRALEAEGESFSRLLNRARRQLATQYLSNPRTRVTDVAEMLGYSSIAAFSRWHAESFGYPARSKGRRSSAYNE